MKNPGTVESHYSFDFKSANEYFKEQKVTKIIDERNAYEMGMSIADFDFKIPSDFDIKPLTKTEFESLIAFRKSKESIVGEEFSMEILVDRFKSGEMSPENSFLIFWKGELAGYVRGTVPDDEQRESPRRAHLGGMILDREFPDGIALRKAMLKATKAYFDQHEIERLSASIQEDNPAKEYYEKIGFQIDKTRGSKHFTYEA